MKLAEVGRMVLDTVFPKRCPWCGKVLGFTKQECSCAGQRQAARLPDKSLAPRELDGRPYVLEEVWARFEYDEPVRGAIIRMKYEEQPELARPLGEELARKFRACGLEGRFDAIVPVPMTEKAKRRRGYNQCALMAQQLARETRLPLPEAVLEKTRQTKRQMALDRKERLTNVVGAFNANPQLAAGKRILLIDDVITTGSTLNECAIALLNVGAQSCSALCLAASRPEYRE